MVEIIKTKSEGKDFVKSDWILLEQTSDTALIFKPYIHSGGVRGFLVRFKKERNMKWEEIPEKDFRKLAVFEGTEIELGTNQLKKLIIEVAKREKISEKGVEYGINEYVVADKDKVVMVDDANKREIIDQLLGSGYSSDFWNILKDKDPKLATKLSAGHLKSEKEDVLVELNSRLNTGGFAETAGNDSWQSWIYKNNWIFGINYREPIEKTKINIAGVMPDYLFPTADDFLDILEIKLPEEEVIIKDLSHNGSYKWSSKSNEAIGQVVNYINEMERLQLEIQREYKRVYKKDISIIKPRAFILVGKSDTWDLEKKEALRKLNYSLHGIEILTYSDLIVRGESIVNFYDSKSEEIINEVMPF